MSKFDHNIFYGGYDSFAASKEKYTKEQAIELYLLQIEHLLGEFEQVIAVGSAWVKHRAGRNEEGEPQVGWWIEYHDSGRNCEAWVFHLPQAGIIESHLEKPYEHYSVSTNKKYTLAKEANNG